MGTFPGVPGPFTLPDTPRGAVLCFEDRAVLCTGDVLVTRNPLTGRTGPQVMPAAFNLDTRLALRSLERLTSLHSELVLPGHGEPWRERVREVVRQTRSVGAS